MKYQRCTRCVMDNVSDSSIKFEADGTCNYCNDVIARRDQEYFPGERGKNYLSQLAEKVRNDCKDDKYDCMVGISGGIDSSYVIYLGYKMGLRMLAVHIDDGYDTKTAKKNITRLCNKANVQLNVVSPNAEQYNDLILSFFKASVPNICFPQDNILFAALDKFASQNKIKYMLSGRNFAHECILERGNDEVNICDKKHLMAIHKEFGIGKIDELPTISLVQRYITSRYLTKAKSINVLNYTDYNLERVLKELNDFCGFEYYGGKHYESILTRFMQCYYLPVKYNEDKRKSHFSSLIVNGQMTRENAIEKLKNNPYIENGLWQDDLEYIANCCRISSTELMELIKAEPKKHSDYPYSALNRMAPIARRFRKFLG